ncbi:hydroxymethylbilane synthase [Marinilabiliaceae bacterium ANBcel2]|nr:hydroxymethylbilane synthase [Marinilabiliaceae bacterium ANBcel2]
MRRKKIVTGTRGSRLALWQANEISRSLKSAHPSLDVEIEVIKTRGDKILDVALSKIGDKGLFTKEIESALLDGSIDIAVHSLKDLPTELPDGLAIGAVLPRGEVRDVLLTSDGSMRDDFFDNCVIATSSLRRRSQILNFKEHIKVIDIRGNVDSRIKKMESGYCDALLMAGAGIERLGYHSKIAAYMDPMIVTPAVSQGAVAVEIREDDEEIIEILDSVNDFATWQQVMAERAFLRTMEGGCQIPVACYSKVKNDSITLYGMVASLDGTNVLRDSEIACGENVAEKAVELAFRMLDNGGREILEDIRV